MGEHNKILEEIRKRGGNPPNPILTEISTRNKAFTYDSQFQTPITFTGSTGLGESMYDEKIPFSELDNINEIRARRQPWIAKTGAGVGRVATKVAAEIAKMPGVLGGIAAGTIGQIRDGITGEDNTDFMQTAFNNPWINTIQHLEETVKDELLPVYVKKAISEGSLVDNIFSMDFWATEGADGLGYIISMLAPGAVINKFGVGAKLLNPIAKGTSKLLGSTEKAANVLKGINLTPKNANLWAATTANTLFEAGAEAKGAMDSFEQSTEYQDIINKIPQRTDEIYNELLRDYKQNGYAPKEQKLDAEGNPIGMKIPTEEEVLTELKEKAATQAQKEAKDVVSKVGAKVFGANAAILYLPNLMVSKMLWGNPVAKGAVKYKKGAFETLEQLTKKESLKYGAKQFAIAGAREGFWEEGMQSTAEQYFTENPEAGLGDTLSDLPEAYADMISDTPGQKAIFLGAFFGGGMQAYHGTKNEKARRTKANMLIGAANKTLKSMDDFLFSDNFLNNSGNLEFNKEGGVKKDYSKVIQKLEGLKSIEDFAKAFDEAVKNNDTDTLNVIQEVMTTNLIKPFLSNEELGLEALQQHLEASSKLIEQDKTEEFNRKKYIKSIMTKADRLKNDYNTYSEFGDLFFDLTDKEASKTDKANFYNRTAMEYVNNRSLKHLVGDQVKEIDALIDKILDPLRSSPEAVSKNSEDFEKLKEKKGVNKAIEPLQKRKDELNNLGEEIDKQIVDLWDNEKVNKKFNAHFKKVKLARGMEKEFKEANVLIKAINEATTEKELAAIVLPEKSRAKGQLEKHKAAKLAEIKEKGRKAGTTKKQTAKEKKEAADLKKAERAEAVESVKARFNVGEKISLPSIVTDKISDNLKSTDGTYLFKGVSSGNSIQLVNDKGTTFAISPLTMRDSASSVTEVTDIDGGTKPGQEDNRDEDGVDPLNGLKTADSTNDARLVVSNNQKGDKNVKLPFISDTTQQFERTPKDKTGSYGVKINKDVKGLDPNWDKALQMIEDNDFSDIEFLSDHLPFNVVITEGSIEIPLETQTKGDTTVFDTTSKVLRETIVKELANGTLMEDITVDLVGQWNGDLQIDGNNENNIADLYDFQGDVKNIKLEDIYYVDQNNTLVNYKKKIYPGGQSRALAPGEVYIIIKTANGTSFPLKLNVARVNDKEADLIYELVKYRFENRFDENGKVKTDDTTNVTPIGQIPGIVENLTNNFPEVIELFKKEKIVIEDMFLKDLFRFFIHDSNKPTFKFRFRNDTFIVGGVVFSKEEFFDNKQGFIDTVTSSEVNHKRRNIKTKKAKKDTNNLNLSRRNYMEYLIMNNILNTNAVVKDFTFQGQTTMYISTNTVKVKGEPSNFNVENTKSYNDNLIGTQEELEKQEPGLFKRGELTKIQPEDANERTYYKDDKTGEEFERVSSVKDQPKSTRPLYLGSKRGDIMDELTRFFFSDAKVSKQEFLSKAADVIIDVNERKNQPNSELEFSDDVLEELYDILEEYKDLFNRNNWTVYANTFPLSGVIGSKGKIAGAMDLLIYDNTNKKWIIIDLKTSSGDRNANYNEKSPMWPYKKNDAIQQNAYRELFKQMTGKDTDLLILPIEIKPENGVEYSNLPIRTSAKKKFLVVEKESIYKLLKISSSGKKKAAPKKTIKKVVKKKTVKDNIKTTKEENKGVVTLNREIFLTQFIEGEFYNIKHKGTEYLVTGVVLNSTGGVSDGFYVAEAPTEFGPLGTPIEDVVLAMAVINALIKKGGVSKSFTKNNAEKIWNSRKNSVPSQKKISTTKKAGTKIAKVKKKSSGDVIRDSFASFSKDELSLAFSELMKLGSEVNSSFMLQLSSLMAEANDEQDGNPTNLDNFLKVYDYLVKQGVDKETIEERCN